MGEEIIGFFKGSSWCTHEILSSDSGNWEIEVYRQVESYKTLGYEWQHIVTGLDWRGVIFDIDPTKMNYLTDKFNRVERIAVLFKGKTELAGEIIIISFKNNKFCFAGNSKLIGFDTTRFSSIGGVKLCFH